jgi:hypothetical protein
MIIRHSQRSPSHPLSFPDYPVFCLGSTTCSFQYLTFASYVLAQTDFGSIQRKCLMAQLVLTCWERNALCVPKRSRTRSVVHFIKHRTLKFSCPFSSIGLCIMQVYGYVGLTTSSSVFVLGTTANLCCIGSILG